MFKAEWWHWSWRACDYSTLYELFLYKLYVKFHFQYLLYYVLFRYWKKSWGDTLGGGGDTLGEVSDTPGGGRVTVGGGCDALGGEVDNLVGGVAP